LTSGKVEILLFFSDPDEERINIFVWIEGNGSSQKKCLLFDDTGQI